MTNLASIQALPYLTSPLNPKSPETKPKTVFLSEQANYDCTDLIKYSTQQNSLVPLNHAFSTVQRSRTLRLVSPPLPQEDLSSESLIANYIKATFSTKTHKEMHEMVRQYFTIIKLQTPDGEWAHPKLANIANQLLPDNLTVQDFTKLIDQMALNASKNPYVHEFLNKAKGIEFPRLAQKLAQEGEKLVPSFAAYAMALQNLTVAMREDREVAKACEAIWRAKRKELGGPYTNIGFDGAIKYHSVEFPVSRMIRALDQGTIHPQFGQIILPLNIIEAMLYDAYSGNKDNLSAGWVAASHLPGTTSNEATGAGGTVITQDGHGISVKMPLPKEWADCYQAWNMAFVSQFPQFPYSMVKLLIPKVSGYQETPDEYIYTRALALYAHLNFILFRPQNGELGAAGEFDWSSPELTKLFGEVNKEKALEYADKVDELNPSLSTRIKNAIVNLWMSISLFLESLFKSCSSKPTAPPSLVRI